MTKHDPLVRLRHMRNFTAKAMKIVQGKTREDIETDEVLALALARLIELIGEAAARVPGGIQSQYPTSPWPQVISTRNRRIHDSMGVDHDILWDTIQIDLPRLAAVLDGALSRETSSDKS